MDALIWKKYIEIRTNKTKTIIFFISPIIYFLFLHMYGVQYRTIVSFFSLAFTLFSSLIHWNVEDLVYSEALLVTRLDTKKSWRINYIFVSILGNIYAYIVLFICTFILNMIGNIEFHLSIDIVIQNLCNILLSMAILGMGTLQYSDFSKAKQIFTSVFSILSIAAPVALVVYGNMVYLTRVIVIIELVLSSVLILAGELIMRLTSNERLIFNIQKMVDGYMNNIIND